MATISAVPFSALPVTDDGYTLLNDNDRVHRSSKKLSELVGDKTSSFLTKEEGDSLYQEKGDYLVEDDITGKLDKEQYANDSATFLTAHQPLDEYATKDWVEEQNYITGVDLTNYYTKSETSGAGELTEEFNKYLKIPTDVEESKQYTYSTTGWSEIVNTEQYETETVTINHKSGWGDAPLYEVTANAGKLIYINQPSSIPTTDIQQIELTLNNVKNTNKPYFAYVKATKILNLCSFIVKDENGTYFTPADCKSYCWLVGDGNSNNKVYLIEFLPNKTFFAHRIGNADNTKFIEVTKNTGKQYYDYVNLLSFDGYMPFIKTEQGLALFAYKTTGGNIVFLSSPNENGEMQKITFVYNTFTVKTTTEVLGGGAGTSNSWKQLSEDYHSSGELTDDKFCVYVGKYNTGFNDSYTMGRENYSEPGVNIGYANKINVERDEILPGNVNIGKENVVLDAGAINIGQNNSAKDFGVNVGEHSIASEGSYNIGDSNIATDASINIGESNSADIASYNIGQYNSAYNAGYTFGQNNRATTGGVAIGLRNSAINCGFVLGQKSYAHNGAVSIGVNCTANHGCFSIGSETSASDGSVTMGNHVSANGGSVAIGSYITAAGGAVCLGNNINVDGGCVAIGARNYKVDNGCQVVGDENTAHRGSTIIGIKNLSMYSTILGNRNSVDMILYNSALSSEHYEKPSFDPYGTPEEIYIKNFVAGLDNTGLYAKNAYILGHYNKITCNSSADYLDTNNDGFTFIFGMRNSADRNYDMAIGYKSIASGGENIAIGVPFETITGYYNAEGSLYPARGITNTLAKGYKNFALRGNVTGISNTAINSNLTGDYIGDDLGHVTANNLINSFVSATTVKEVDYDGDHYFVTGYMLNNIIENSNALLTGQYINDNQLTNVANTQVSAESFSFNKFYHTEKVNLTGRHINTNTFLHTNYLNIESENLCRNIILNCAETYSAKITASKIFADNIIAKTDFASTGDSISSINENIIFNSYINGSATQKYISWDTLNDCNFTRNFLFGSYLGNYIYNTFSFCDNSNRYTEFKLENTIRVFNFGDNTINKSENSFVFGDENKTSAIARTFVFGKRNNINKTKLTNVAQDYVNDIFVFGYENNLIADNDNVDYPILERNRIFGIHNYIKSSEHLDDNLIVGNCNSISYNTTKPTKNTIRQNVNFPSTPYSSESAAFATCRNNIFGNGNRVSQCITDSLIVGAGNYVFDTIEHSPNMTADYNSIYTLGVGNIAYDGSNQLNIGYNNETSGHFAEAIGDGIVAKGQQLIIGKCNAIVDNTNRYSIEYDSDTDTIKNIEQSGVIFAIGNGTYDYAARIYDSDYIEYYDKNKNKIPSANVNNEEYITRSNALIVSANGVVSANNYKTSAGYVITEANLTPINELIQQLQNKITALETIISSNSANWVLTSQA